MKPFRYAYLVFNPQYLVSASKGSRHVNGKTHYFVRIEMTERQFVDIATIDELEQEGTLASFLIAWLAALQ